MAGLREKDIVAVPMLADSLHGRRKICVDASSVNEKNLLTVLSKALTVHRANAMECTYLYNFYRGIQDIQYKEKLVRPQINNKVMVNIANEIVAFKTAYFNTAPIQYVSAGGEDEVSAAVEALNGYMRAEDKASKDKEICDWFHICGVAPRLCLPDSEGEEEGSPACIYTLDPREAFVAYYSGIGRPPVMGVVLQHDEEGEEYACVYTPGHYYEVKGQEIVVSKKRAVPYIPLVEYINNEARMGAFEVVLPLLNAINTLSSNRVDNVQDFVNAYDVFQNCELQEGQYDELAQGGHGLNIKTTVPGQEAKVYRIASELKQEGVQKAIDDLYSNVLNICGMPSQGNASGSTSDTGTATIMRNGWYAADSRANDTEKLFNRAERQFLKLFLYICQSTGDLPLKLGDIKIEHTRNNLSNMQSRMQILCEGLNNDKIHPKVAWLMSGLPNAEEFYRMSQKYYEEEQEALAKSLPSPSQQNRTGETKAVEDE